MDICQKEIIKQECKNSKPPKTEIRECAAKPEKLKGRNVGQCREFKEILSRKDIFVKKWSKIEITHFAKFCFVQIKGRLP